MSTVPQDFWEYDYLRGRRAEGWPAPGTPVIAYRRASTENQHERGSGLDDQRRELEREAALRGYTVVEDVAEVYSGTYTTRPGLERLHALLTAGAARHVLALNLGRLSRAERPIETALVHDAIVQAGGVLLVPGRDYSGEQGHLMLTLDASQYSRERLDLLTRLHSRRENRVRGDKRPTGTGRAPDGYQWAEPIGKLRKTHYVIDQHRAPIVREIILRLGRGESTRAIIRWLEKAGHHPRRWTPENPVRWSTSRILAIAHNPIYEGAPVGLRTRVRRVQVPGSLAMRTLQRERPVADWVELAEGTAPAIVTAEERAAALAGIANNKRYQGPPVRRTRWLLSGGYAVCGRCGATLSPHGGSRLRADGQPDDYYRCSTANHRGVAVCPGVGSIHRELLDAAVWAAICQAADQPERLRAWADESLEAELPEVREAALVEARLAKTLRQRDQTAERLDEDTEMPADERAASTARLLGYRQTIADLRAKARELTAVLAQRDERQAAVGQLIEGLVKLRHLHAGLAETPVEEQRDAVQWLGVRVVAHGREACDWRIALLSDGPGRVSSEPCSSFYGSPVTQHLAVPLPLPV